MDPLAMGQHREKTGEPRHPPHLLVFLVTESEAGLSNWYQVLSPRPILGEAHSSSAPWRPNVQLPGGKGSLLPEECPALPCAPASCRPLAGSLNCSTAPARNMFLFA